jgi:hypothetical protein
MERLTLLLAHAIDASPDALQECMTKVEEAEVEVERLGRELEKFRL